MAIINTYTRRTTEPQATDLIPITIPSARANVPAGVYLIPYANLKSYLSASSRTGVGLGNNQKFSFLIPSGTNQTLTAATANAPAFYNLPSFTGAGVSGLLTQSVVSNVARVTIAKAGYVNVHLFDEFEIISSTGGQGGRDANMTLMLTQYGSDGVSKREWEDTLTIEDPITAPLKRLFDITTGIIDVEAGDYFTLNFAFLSTVASRNIVFKVSSDNANLDERFEFIYFETLASKYKGAWVAGAYEANDLVVYSDKLYVCKATRTVANTTTPDNDSTGWALLGGGGSSYKGAWRAGTYAIGDTVTYNNNIYFCLVARTSANTANPSFDTSSWLNLSKKYTDLEAQKAVRDALVRGQNDTESDLNYDNNLDSSGPDLKKIVSRIRDDRIKTSMLKDGSVTQAKLAAGISSGGGSLIVVSSLPTSGIQANKVYFLSAQDGDYARGFYYRQGSGWVRIEDDDLPVRTTFPADPPTVTLALVSSTYVYTDGESGGYLTPAGSKSSSVTNFSLLLLDTRAFHASYVYVAKRTSLLVKTAAETWLENQETILIDGVEYGLGPIDIGTTSRGSRKTIVPLANKGSNIGGSGALSSLTLTDGQKISINFKNASGTLAYAEPPQGFILAQDIAGTSATYTFPTAKNNRLGVLAWIENLNTANIPYNEATVPASFRIDPATGITTGGTKPIWINRLGNGELNLYPYSADRSHTNSAFLAGLNVIVLTRNTSGDIRVLELSKTIQGVNNFKGLVAGDYFSQANTDVAVIDKRTYLPTSAATPERKAGEYRLIDGTYERLDTGDGVYKAEWTAGTSYIPGDIVAVSRIIQDREPSKDISLGSDSNISASTFADGTIWFVHQVSNTARAYTASTRARDTSKDISLPGTAPTSGFGRWEGAASDGTTLWFVDNPANKAYAYTASTRARDTSKDITLDNKDWEGAVYSGGTLWFIDDVTDGASYARAYNATTLARETGKDIWLGNQRFDGAVAKDGTIYFLDDQEADVAVAYDTISRFRQPAKDIRLEGQNWESAVSDGTNIWFVGIFFDFNHRDFTFSENYRAIAYKDLPVKDYYINQTADNGAVNPANQNRETGKWQQIDWHADYASHGEAQIGRDDLKLMTPLRTRQAIDFLKPNKTIAEQGTSNQFLMTPLSTKQAIDHFTLDRLDFLALETQPTDLSSYPQDSILRINSPAPGKWLEVKGANTGELHLFKMDGIADPNNSANWGFSSFGDTYGKLKTWEGSPLSDPPVTRLEFRDNGTSDADATLLIAKDHVSYANAPANLYLRFYQDGSNPVLVNSVKFARQADNPSHDYTTYIVPSADTGDSEGVWSSRQYVTGFGVFTAVPTQGDETTNAYNFHAAKSVVEIDPPLIKATRAEAEAGTNDVKYMTPLKVKQAVDEYGGSGGGSSSGNFIALDNEPTDLSSYDYNTVLRVNKPDPGKWFEVEGANDDEQHLFKMSGAVDPNNANKWGVSYVANASYGSLMSWDGGKTFSASESPIIKIEFTDGGASDATAVIWVAKSYVTYAAAPTNIWFRFFEDPPNPVIDTVKFTKQADVTSNNYIIYSVESADTGDSEGVWTLRNDVTGFGSFTADNSQTDQTSNAYDFHPAKSLVEIDAPLTEAEVRRIIRLPVRTTFPSAVAEYGDPKVTLGSDSFNAIVYSSANFANGRNAQGSKEAAVTNLGYLRLTGPSSTYTSLVGVDKRASAGVKPAAETWLESQQIVTIDGVDWGLGPITAGTTSRGANKRIVPLENRGTNTGSGNNVTGSYSSGDKVAINFKDNMGDLAYTRGEGYTPPPAFILAKDIDAQDAVFRSSLVTFVVTTPGSAGSFSKNVFHNHIQRGSLSPDISNIRAIDIQVLGVGYFSSISVFSDTQAFLTAMTKISYNGLKSSSVVSATASNFGSTGIYVKQFRFNAGELSLDPNSFRFNYDTASQENVLGEDTPAIAARPAGEWHLINGEYIRIGAGEESTFRRITALPTAAQSKDKEIVELTEDQTKTNGVLIQPQSFAGTELDSSENPAVQSGVGNRGWFNKDEAGFNFGEIHPDLSDNFVLISDTRVYVKRNTLTNLDKIYLGTTSYNLTRVAQSAGTKIINKPGVTEDDIDYYNITGGLPSSGAWNDLRFETTTAGTFIPASVTVTKGPYQFRNGGWAKYGFDAPPLQYDKSFKIAVREDRAGTRQDANIAFAASGSTFTKTYPFGQDDNPDILRLTYNNLSTDTDTYQRWTIFIDLNLFADDRAPTVLKIGNINYSVSYLQTNAGQAVFKTTKVAAAQRVATARTVNSMNIQRKDGSWAGQTGETKILKTLDKAGIQAISNAAIPVHFVPSNPHTGQKIEPLQDLTVSGGAIVTAAESEGTDSRGTSITGLFVGYEVDSLYDNGSTGGDLGSISPANSNFGGFLSFSNARAAGQEANRTFFVSGNRLSYIPTKILINNIEYSLGSAVNLIFYPISTLNGSFIKDGQKYLVNPIVGTTKLFPDKTLERGKIYVFDGLQWIEEVKGLSQSEVDARVVSLVESDDLKATTLPANFPQSLASKISKLNWITKLTSTEYDSLPSSVKTDESILFAEPEVSD